MKPNRSDVYTSGLACTVEGYPDHRLPLFEIDELGNPDVWFRIMEAYRYYRLDVLAHRTMKGWHFLSPTLLLKETWKLWHSNLKDINPECPMTTLRLDPNKYPEESSLWNIHLAEYWADPQRNVEEVASLLNTRFGTSFAGGIRAKPKVVRYPLPLI